MHLENIGIFFEEILLLAIALTYWRRKMQSASLRKLSRSWPTAGLWFGLTGLVLVVARAEGIQYVAMRVWWVVWALVALGYLIIQLRLFRARHYEIIPAKKLIDPRDEYLPKAKRK